MPWFHAERRGLIRADVFSFRLEQVEYAHKKPLLTSGAQNSHLPLESKGLENRPSGSIRG